MWPKEGNGVASSIKVDAKCLGMSAKMKDRPEESVKPGAMSLSSLEPARSLGSLSSTELQGHALREV